MPLFSRYLHEADIPIVTDRRSADSDDPNPEDRRKGHKIFTELKCAEPAVDLTIRWSMDHYFHNAVGQPNIRYGEEQDEGYFLMMVTDFDKLCFLFKHLCQYANPRGVYVASGKKERRAELRVIDQPIPDDLAPLPTSSTIRDLNDPPRSYPQERFTAQSPTPCAGRLRP